MGIDGSGAVERFLQRTLLPVCALSGAVVVAGFFFPEFVGTAVEGRTWLVVALLFFGSGLGYIAVLPGQSDDDDPESGSEYLVTIRRLTLRDVTRGFIDRHDPVTFGVPVLVFAVFFSLMLVFPSRITGAVSTVREFLLTDVSVLFLGATAVSVVYCLFLLLGPWGDVKLGGPEEEPTYTYPTYFALVFTAGIAAGIVFWGPAESLFHYQNPPPYFESAPRTEGAILGALTYSLFHWGISAWSAYTVIAIPIAYFVFQHNAPLRVSAILTPFLGVENLDSPLAKLVDTLAVFATIGGIATSVALVSGQFLTGIEFQWGVDSGTLGPLLFVGGLTLIFVLSTATGIHRGIRRIAALNVVLFGLFALLLLAVGPRGFVLEWGTAAVGNYGTNFVQMSVFLDGKWIANWTGWYWSWWFSWAPFAGLFLAALSRGRRVRTVVFTSVVATSAATMVWFLLLGGTALSVQHSGVADILGAMNERARSEAVAGFPIFEALPLTELLVFLFLALIVVFITTSADTSTLVVTILATRPEETPTTASIVFWGTFQGLVAVSALVIGGVDGVETLQAIAVLTGGPFAIIAMIALVGLTIAFRRREKGHTSVVGKVRERLPHVQAHHDVDPPGEE
jgi:choline/carnitine/betaine transport